MESFSYKWDSCRPFFSLFTSKHLVSFNFPKHFLFFFPTFLFSWYVLITEAIIPAILTYFGGGKKENEDEDKESTKGNSAVAGDIENVKVLSVSEEAWQKGLEGNNSSS